MNAKKAQREILTVNSQQQIVAGVETPSVERSRLAQGRPERSQRGRRRRGERGRRSAVGISGIQALEPYWGKRCSKGVEPVRVALLDWVDPVRVALLGIIINIARGAIIDEKELVGCLVRGEIAGAGLDVFENEPNVPKELFAMDNVVLLPHRAAFTEGAFFNAFRLVMDNLEAFFSNRPLLSPVIDE
ncbi:hypothetical protein RHGRI_001505 [Rhododendron griersonianum]|uniref:D-isomer specific 2-hydroxyacid dehydrogenase NAD-binding domain-containing protein n=1 Tax=Rhododendron griersonianum TaxID=479676 RepID=A0AAV6LNE7_9ERIC|nr:hypothetical protein RHGRI_001505 [Rhododendron griersonianum]